MLNDKEREALTRWYSRDEVVAQAKKLFDQKEFHKLEDFLQKTVIFPLGRHDALPDYMRDDEGEPLFPTNLDPRVDVEKWRDAVEVAWTVMKDRNGFGQDDIHKNIAQLQQDDWDSFMKSVDEREKARKDNDPTMN